MKFIEPVFERAGERVHRPRKHHRAPQRDISALENTIARQSSELDLRLTEVLELYNVQSRQAGELQAAQEEIERLKQTISELQRVAKQQRVNAAVAQDKIACLRHDKAVLREQLDTLAVEAALKDQLGTPLPLIDESAVKAVLVTFPIVESYSLEARPPHELVVRIVERTPIGLIQTRAGYTLVDAAGVALSTTETPAAGRPLVTVAGGTGSPAFEAIGQVMRSLPDSIATQVTAVSASTPDDVTLTLGGANAQVVWGSAEDSAMKALVLEKAMVARPPASVSVYDVSSPSAIVVR